MEVLERYSGENAYGILFDCENGSLNFNDVFFFSRGFNNNIFHQIFYSLVELRVHEDILYYDATFGIYFHH